MKVKELMIGDWVNFSGHGYVQVMTICNVCRCRDKDGIYYTKSDCFVPICIDEEILTRNGFEKIHDVWDVEEWADETRRVTITSNVSNTIERGWYAHVDNENMDSIGGCDVEYVHQLQQILRLCGNKKEIEL